MDIFNGSSGPYFPPQFRYVGYVLVITGCIMIYNVNLFGIGFVVIGPAFFLLKTGIRINFNERSYQEYRSVLGLYFGKWVKLPEIEYVTVYSESESQDMHVQSIGSAYTTTYFNTDLIFEEPNRLKLISFQDKPSAIEAGRVLAKKLQTRLLDYTSEEPVWMDDILETAEN